MTRHDDVKRGRTLTLDGEAQHGLRNQLAIILGFCEAMSRDVPLSETTRSDIDEIRQAANAALAIVTAASDDTT